MKFKIPFLVLLFVFALRVGAQSYYNDNSDKPITYEAGISFGPMNSLTDIGGRPGYGQKGPKDLNIKSTTLFGSIYGAAVYKNFLALRAEATIGRVQSNDSLLKGIKTPNKAIGRYNRNLSFRSPIYEFSITAEFHPTDFFSNFSPETSPHKFSPYVIGGIGYFHFNPQAYLDDPAINVKGWVDLRPLHTEGEGFAEYPNRKEYKLNQINVPWGVGAAYELSPKFNLRLEYISRILFTDYLDDVHDTYIDPQLFSKYLSGTKLAEALILNNRRRADAVDNQTTARPGGRRGNPNDNDSYFTINIRVGFVFGKEKSSSHGGSTGPSYKKSKNLSKLLKQQRQCPKRF